MGAKICSELTYNEWVERRHTKKERKKGRKKERKKERKERNDEFVNVKVSGNFVVWWFTQQRQEAVTIIGTFLQ